MSEATTLTKRAKRRNERTRKQLAENENPTPTRRQIRKSIKTLEKLAENELSTTTRRQRRRQRRKTVQEKAGGGRVGKSSGGSVSSRLSKAGPVGKAN